MATSIVKSVELDFAEFASTLISETLNAVITSMLTQEKQVAELEQQVLLSPEQYAKEYLPDELVRAEILRLFPSNSGREEQSSVDIGEPYTINGENDESPLINKKIDYTITQQDLDTITTNNKISQTVINQTGYGHIYAAVRLTLAAQHLAVFKQIIKRGIPRVYVTEGHIKSKLTLRFEDQMSTNTTTPLTASPKIASLGIRRLFVQPVNATKPEILTLNADILSEIEVTFKTVIP
jgi:hypothetical protein